MHFSDAGTEDIYDGIDSRDARSTLPRELCKAARRKMDMILSAGRLEDLKVPPGNHLEALKGNLKGYYSVRINDQYRIIFRWEDEKGASKIKIVDYH